MMKRQDKDPSTNQSCLTTEMYPDETNLSIRIRTHELYTQPDIDFTAWILDQINWGGYEVVLDVGCGAGMYTKPALTRVKAPGVLVSADLSFGMLMDFRKTYQGLRINPLNTNILALPVTDNTYDVVLANHMLYHVPDIPQALKEILRCLQQGGHLIAATNSESSMQEFIDEVNTAIHHLGNDLMLPRSQARDNFSLENGLSILESAFDHPIKAELDSALVFPQPEPVIKYINSLRSFYEKKLPQELTWESILDLVYDQVRDKIKRNGEYRVSKKTGVFVARKHTK